VLPSTVLSPSAIEPDRHARPRRVLYLTHHYPWPPTSGGRLREAELLRRLLHHASIDLVAVSRHPEIEQAAAYRQHFPHLRADVFADESPGGEAPARESRAARRHLANYLRHTEPDLIHVEGHYLLDMLPASALDRTVLIEHNVESELLRQRAQANPSSRLGWTLTELRRCERQAWTAVARVAALTTEDCARIRRTAPRAAVRCSPNGADHLPPRSQTTAFRIGPIGARLLFVANFAYPPNQDAALWAVREILPQVVAAAPAARLALVGPGLAGEALNAALNSPAIDVLGWVPRIQDQLDQADVVICPLRIGGGIKVKVLEALRRGCALVATPIAAEGLPVTLRASIPIAADAASFAQQVVRLLHDPAHRAWLQARLMLEATHLPTWDEAAARLLAIWDEVIPQAKVRP